MIFLAALGVALNQSPVPICLLHSPHVAWKTLTDTGHAVMCQKEQGTWAPNRFIVYEFRDLGHGMDLCVPLFSHQGALPAELQRNSTA